MKDYFELLGLKVNYTFDQEKFKQLFLQKQLKFHPDRAKTPEEKQLFLEKSITLNEAKKILEDDYLRAEYILKLANINIEEAARTRPLSQNELEEVIKLNEQVTESSDINFLTELKQEKLAEKKQLISNLNQAFFDQNLFKALDLTTRLKYLTNLVRNIEQNIKYANYRD